MMNNMKQKVNLSCRLCKDIGLLFLLPALALSGMLASCSQEELPATDVGTPLPEGKYPLVLTASVGEMQTRSAGKDEWTNDDPIGVRIGDAGAKVGKYLVSNGGSTRPASAGEALYWQNTAPATITAWYPYDATEVSLSDQSDASFIPVDFLLAETKANYQQKNVDLKFQHRMARVKYTLTNEAGITDPDWENVDVAIYGYTTVKSDAAGGLNGSIEGWIIPGKEDTWLLPQDNMTDKPFIKVSAKVGGSLRDFVYTPTGDAAILETGKVHTYNITVFRDKITVQLESSVAWGSGSGMSGDNPGTVAYHMLTLNYDESKLNGDIVVTDNATEKKIIISQDGTYHLPSAKTRFTITYKPTSWMDSFVPTAGLCYMNRTYNEQYKQYKTELTGVISDITLTLQKYVAVGDYYYSDGTWAAIDNAYANLQSIGVVFHAGAGADDHINHYDQSEGTEILGYVVALTDLLGNPNYNTGVTCWGGKIAKSGDEWKLENFDVPELGNNTYNKSGECDAVSYDGYTRTKIIRENYIPQSDIYSFPAFKACDTYEPSAPQKGKSSSWYIPSAAMMKDINVVKNKAGITGNYFSSTEEEGKIWSVVGYAFHNNEYTGREKNDNNTKARAVITIFKQKK